MKVRFELDVQIGRLFFRVYKTRGFGLSWKSRRSSQSLVTTHVGWLMFELSWLHKDDCSCDECIPF
jgi:hypothetical protein